MGISGIHDLGLFDGHNSLGANERKTRRMSTQYGTFARLDVGEALVETTVADEKDKEVVDMEWRRSNHND